ncbi:glycosyltransferase family 4 protein [Leptospira kanakyensis]|uniref:glycosyltransferase family 4 protein n=1 Tax=Leptospira kanakyensis TaxID=2484968 RepID=UPI00223D5508|nr:glycosyltransferase family 1 protein [Leptospira kanakyensis]MCW7482114.1 glycosyltransferase family 4 protein [Leptospira kanakyensis]
MILGIDASNIRGGGGITHLKEFLDHSDPKKFGFTKVFLWSGSKTLQNIKSKPWLIKVSVPELDKSLLHRSYWQKYKLSAEAERNHCNLLFIPGGSYSGNFPNIVSMSQNLLPFEWKEMFRYGLSITTFKFLILRFIQSFTFLKSNGVIFLTQYARKRVLEQFRIKLENTIVISHGINQKFFFQNRVQKDFTEFTWQSPAKVLYVSFVGEYKHQWNVVYAISRLLDKGIPIELTLVGDLVDPTAVAKLKRSLIENHKWSQYLLHFTKVSYDEIDILYKKADLFLFASTCETFGQIITEAMASGLPIVTSDNMTLQEILGQSSIFFDSENIDSIAESTELLLRDKILREQFAEQVFNKAKLYSWDRCAAETFRYFQKITKNLNE